MRRTLSFVCSVSVLCLAVGCGGDKGPTEMEPIRWWDLLTPEKTRELIEYALENRIVQPTYERALAGPPFDSLFAYLPDANAEANAPPDFYAGWDKGREVRFMLALLDSSATLQKVTLDFNRYTRDPDFPATTDLQRYDVEYVLTLTYLDGNPPVEIVKRYGAIAKWDFIGGDINFWTLLTWKDIAPLEGPTNPIIGTMGTLRAMVGPWMIACDPPGGNVKRSHGGDGLTGHSRWRRLASGAR